MNKPVIFIDFGGVYFTYASKSLGKYFKKYKTTEKKFLKVLLGPAWTSHATGKIGENEYWKLVSEEIKIPFEETNEIRHVLYNGLYPQNGMKELVKKLRKKYKVAALSSITAPWIEVIEKNYKVSKVFHECHYTFNHGIDKPDAGFFLSAAKKMNADPKDCVVVDDMKKFLTAVRKTGARTILFKNSRQLEKELIKMGVII
jgi:HAD superfamily hydrolase (TIGR01509 family)